MCNKQLQGFNRIVDAKSFYLGQTLQNWPIANSKCVYLWVENKQDTFSTRYADMCLKYLSVSKRLK